MKEPGAHDERRDERIERLVEAIAAELELPDGDSRFPAAVPAALTAGQLRHVLLALSEATPVTPSEEMTRRLIEELRPHVPEPRFRWRMEAERARTGALCPGALPPVAQRPGVQRLGAQHKGAERSESARGSIASRLAGLLSAVQLQAAALGRAFWVASALLYAVVAAAGLLPVAPRAASWGAGGAAAGNAETGNAEALVMLLLLFMPVLAVAAVGFAFRSNRSGLWEAERACPVDPLALVLARFLAVTGHAVVAAGIVTLILAALRLNTKPGVLLLTWLAPLLFFSSITMFVSVRWDGWTGSFAGLSAWAGFLLLHLKEVRFDLLALPGDSFWLAGKLTLIALTAVLWAAGLPWLRRGLPDWQMGPS